MEYRTTVEDEHWREEEFQWARILSEGDAARAMTLLYLQKACTAFHEFQPAWGRGALREQHIDFFRGRLANRVRQVLVTMRNNGLDEVDGAAELSGILRSIESAKTMDELAGLAEELHAVGHKLLDSLEAY